MHVTHAIFLFFAAVIAGLLNSIAGGGSFVSFPALMFTGIPGVEAAAVSDSLPPDRQGDADTFRIEGRDLAPGEMNPVVSHGTVGPDFFRALGIRLVKGRYFNSHDSPESAPVAIVSEGFVRRFLPNQEAVGKRLNYSGTWMEIVGVVGNVKYLGLTADTDPAYYIPFAQSYNPQMFLVVRSSSDAANVAEVLRQNIQSIDSGATLAQIATMEQALDLSVSQLLGPKFIQIGIDRYLTSFTSAQIAFHGIFIISLIYLANLLLGWFLSAAQVKSTIAVGQGTMNDLRLAVFER